MTNSPSTKRPEIGIFQIGLIVLTLIVLAAQVADTAFALPKEISSLIHMIDTFACALFFADFCYRFYQAESKLRFMKWGWIDLIASIPNLEVFRWGRLVRVLRVIRLLRGVRSLQLVLGAVFQQRLRGGVISLAFAAILLVGFSSISILVCERAPEPNIKNAEDALWWSITTITTVGYGDRFPVTTEGRVIGTVLMLAGVSMFGCLSGLAASFFLGAQRDKIEETKELVSRLEQVLSEFERLKSRLPQESAPQESPVSI